VDTSTTTGGGYQGLRDRVLTQLRRRIADGEYAQGERLTEDRLADQFGVSRNPVREALQVVESEGFVVVEPRRGAVVAGLDDKVVRDVFAVRERLEPLAAGLAAERATADDVTGLRALLDRASAATDAGDLDAVAWLDGDLHLRVVEISRNRWLISIATALYHHCHRATRSGPGPREPHSWREHVPLVDAIAAGDREAATEVARRHAEEATRKALRLDTPSPDGHRPDA
jgi:DNA-binding GntR family transcriptional regulator